jgi:hypothetical protein
MSDGTDLAGAVIGLGLMCLMFVLGFAWFVVLPVIGLLWVFGGLH